MNVSELARRRIVKTDSLLVFEDDGMKKPPRFEEGGKYKV